ncbi:MAG: glutathione S-transferase family protein, partial [Pseudomonadales bacterium]|nr:glutathione S-transferase family protein [Pseudomonadales bacterium]
MAAFGGAPETEIPGPEALDIARATEPEEETRIAAMGVDGLAAGDEVEVMPIDYGFNPVRGKLQIASLEELVVRREDEDVGSVAVHFPRLGFQIKKVEAE